MKKLIITTILVLLFCAFAACNSDDDQTTPPQTVEDPMEEDPIEEDPVDEVVDRTDRLLDRTVSTQEQVTTYTLQYQDEIVDVFNYGEYAGGRSFYVLALEDEKITEAKIFKDASGGSWSYNITLTYTDDRIQQIHSVYNGPWGETAEWDTFVDHNGDQMIQ